MNRSPPSVFRILCRETCESFVGWQRVPQHRPGPYDRSPYEGALAGLQEAKEGSARMTNLLPRRARYRRTLHAKRWGIPDSNPVNRFRTMIIQVGAQCSAESKLCNSFLLSVTLTQATGIILRHPNTAYSNRFFGNGFRLRFGPVLRPLGLARAAEESSVLYEDYSRESEAWDFLFGPIRIRWCCRSLDTCSRTRCEPLSYRNCHRAAHRTAGRT